MCHERVKLLHNKPMKRTVFALLFLVIACDPEGFGYKKNPAFILDAAFKAVSNMDHEGLLEVSGKEALCVYGNAEGVTYLKENLALDIDNVKIKHTLRNSRRLEFPEFVGYWSYYSEQYLIDVHDKKSNELLLQTLMDCDYGTVNKKEEELQNLVPKKYPMKGCRLTKIIPKKFQPLELSTRCESFRINL